MSNGILSEGGPNRQRVFYWVADCWLLFTMKLDAQRWQRGTHAHAADGLASVCVLFVAWFTRCQIAVWIVGRLKIFKIGVDWPTTQSIQILKDRVKSEYLEKNKQKLSYYKKYAFAFIYLFNYLRVFRASVIAF